MGSSICALRAGNSYLARWPTLFAMENIHKWEFYLLFPVGTEQTNQSSVDGKKTRRPLCTSGVSRESSKVMDSSTCQSTSSQEKDATQTAVEGRPEEETLSSSKLLSSQEPARQELQSPEDSLSEPSQEDQDTENQEGSTEDSSRQLCLCPETRTSLSSGASEEDNDSDLKESRRFLQKQRSVRASVAEAQLGAPHRQQNQCEGEEDQEREKLQAGC
ncbi:uncharacterized protein LOC135330088 [Dromaius novaehollandiae]|uniref:uncharacterized protein LOC135330084 n=1 Tax=Dromaius novaehollandiae TaxID=8790 RepID=UPI0031202950